MRIFFLGIAFLFVNIVSAQTFGGNNPKTKWLQINTKSSNIIFTKDWQQQATQIGLIIDSLQTNKPYRLGNKNKKWNIVVQNQTTIPNAYVRLAPVRSEFFGTPDFDNITSGTLPWIELLTKHEQRHMEQFTNFNNGLTKLFTFILGQEGQLFANGITVPDYFFEGDAVYQETVTTQQGRGKLPAFFSGMKALNLDKTNYSWMKLRNGSLKDFVPDHYALGYQIVAYGYEKYGADFWRKVVKDATSFKGLFYAYQKAITKYSGLSYKQFQKNALTFFAPNKTQHNTFLQSIQWVHNKSKNYESFDFPQLQDDGKIIALKKTFKTIPKFIRLNNNTEEIIATKYIGIDDYFHTNGKSIVYSCYNVNGRFENKNYSNIVVLDIGNKKQKQITKNAKYFQPSLNNDGTEIVAVEFSDNAKCSLKILNTLTGDVIQTITNSENYIYTYPKFWNNNIISIVRNLKGENAIAKTNRITNETIILIPFTFKVMGYPSIHQNNLFFTIADDNADKIAALNLEKGITSIITKNENSIFYPSANDQEIYFSVVTSKGNRIASTKWNGNTNTIPTENILMEKNDAIIQIKAPILTDTTKIISTTKYKETKHLFNFHSRRPFYNDPEIGLTLYSENTLNNLQTELSYTYNTSEKSHGFTTAINYAKYLPVFTLGANTTFNRNIQTNTTLFHFNSAKLYTGAFIPLNWVIGKSFQNLNFGAYFNTEQLLYTGIGKNIFKNKSFQYNNYFIQFSNVIQKTKMQINPRFAQTFSASYRDAFTLRDNKKLVVNSNFYFPGIAPTHSFVINASLQRRDTLSDIFSRTFSFARGYNTLNTRYMRKIGFNYHFPLLYPDFGFGNIAFLQRIRANVFYDYGVAKARVSGNLTNIKTTSIGTEIFLDGKIWNSFPVNIGVRYTHLLNTDLIDPLLKSKWEIILPLNLIPE